MGWLVNQFDLIAGSSPLKVRKHILIDIQTTCELGISGQKRIIKGNKLQWPFFSDTSFPPARGCYLC